MYFSLYLLPSKDNAILRFCVFGAGRLLAKMQAPRNYGGDPARFYGEPEPRFVRREFGQEERVCDVEANCRGSASDQKDYVARFACPTPISTTRNDTKDLTGIITFKAAMHYLHVSLPRTISRLIKIKESSLFGVECEID